MTDFTYETVLSTLTGDGVRTIALNRPASLNAMNRALIDDLARAVSDANACPDTSVLILTGEGRAFCAGDDRREHVHPETEGQARAHVEAIQSVTRALVFGEKPVVGAIHGWAVGGGFEWALNCDFPIWADSARAFFPEVSLNVFVTGGVTSILPAIVGPVKAREMLYLGDRYTAADLLACGVAWRVVPDDDLKAEAQTLAARLAALPPLSLRAMKRVLTQAGGKAITHALDLETEATIACFLDPETTRRMTDF